MIRNFEEIRDMLALSGFYYKLMFFYTNKKTDKIKIDKKQLLKEINEACYFPKKAWERIEEIETSEEIISFLEECNKKIDRITEERDKQTELVLNDFDADVRSAFMNVLPESYFSPRVKAVGNEVAIVAVDNDSYIQNLIFHNAKITGQLYESATVWYELNKTENGYRFEILLRDENSDGEFKEDNLVIIEFSDVSLKTVVFNGMNCPFDENPWEYLGNVAQGICSKAEFTNVALNSEEKELLPLAGFLDKCFFDKEDLILKYEAECFIELAKEKGCEDVVKDVEKILNAKNHSKQELYKKQLISVICKQKYESLWREVFERFSKAQSNYPSKAETVCPPEYLAEKRNAVTDIFRENGYEGEYPDFYKKVNSSKVSLNSSYSVSYFAGGKKKTEYHIKCVEYSLNGELTIEFICSRGFLRKKDKNSFAIADAYSCTFNSSGKSFFDVLLAYFPKSEDEEGLFKTPDVREFAQVAVKKAEHKRLSKEERENYHFQTQAPFSHKLIAFIMIFLFTGILFGIFMTLGFMLIEVVLGFIVTGSFETVGELLSETPWWLLFLGSSALFGLSIAFIEVLAKK